ncbi:hypothetical protein G7072_12415 [Nocardioides sp. HDW12B]|uniref:hypothetical protein n=1 Tax=Nocardioides sp. HDW12B TaxID=2714939 RepID=UPI00140C08D1|nr:hypothetical protein [Nocardioides sp. HDW12B]QIK67039.1 hypothetical protein G7072_12415 [Nocardioides sp. HDW12B]
MTSTTREVACLAWDLVPVVRHEQRRGNRLVDHDPNVPLSVALAAAAGPLHLSHRLDVASLRSHFLLPRCLTVTTSPEGDVLRCAVSGLELRGGTRPAPAPGPAWSGRRLVLSTRVEQLLTADRAVVCTPGDFTELVAAELERGNTAELARRDPHRPETFELAATPDLDAVHAEFHLPRCVTAVRPVRGRLSLGCSQALTGAAGTGPATAGAESWRHAVRRLAPPPRVFAARHGDLEGDLVTTAWQHVGVRAAGTELLLRRAAEDPYEVQSLHRSGAWVDAAHRLAVDLPARGRVEETPLTPQEARRVAQQWREAGRLVAAPEDL